MASSTPILESLLAASPPVPTGIWPAISGAIENNPTLTLLALIAGAFSAGFAVRKLFEDREAGRLRSRVAELEESHKAATDRHAQSESRSRQSEQLAGRLTEFLTPDYVRSMLAEHLAAWPPEKHALVVAAVMRQLLLVPGAAWLCTPTDSILIKVDMDTAAGAARHSMVIDRQTDPLKDLRQLVTDPELLNSVLLDLAIHGTTSVIVATGPDGRVGLRVRQGPNLQWSTVKSTYQRQKATKQP